ncbi:MAG TPA: hypothetical protein VFG07_00120 [Thermoplasmata archaeon]|nr:hypothetical protein [Thermoplasmata archaeon]
MTLDDWLLPLAAFLGGLVVASLAWWVARRVRPESAVDGADPPPRPPAPESSAVPSLSPRPPAVSAPSDAGRRGTLRISQRVVLHLSRQPRLAYGDVAPPELTQAGMARALTTSQPTLARVLQRLVDGDAVLEMRTHVRGQPQRLKVYQLTALGESIARDLRARAGSATGSPESPRGHRSPAATIELSAPIPAGEP